MKDLYILYTCTLYSQACQIKNGFTPFKMWRIFLGSIENGKFMSFITGGMIQPECVTVAYLFMIFSTMSTWLVVVMTFDRCLAIVKPFYHPKWRSVKATKYTVGIIFVMCMILNLPYIFSPQVSLNFLFNL